jgi:hypothetical protein
VNGPSSRTGQQLWQLLPRIYRKDAEGQHRSDLAGYLDAYGALLDAVRATLDQRLADCFVDPPVGPDDLSSQPWLLPYFARLVDAAPTSPHVEGRRREVAEAIALRQMKGTRAGVERAAEVVTGKAAPGRGSGRVGAEVELREGWTLVAVTPRVGTPLLAPRAHGVADPMPDGVSAPPTVAARHPGLPVSVVDTRLESGAVRVPESTPFARTSSFGGETVTWQVEDVQGVPHSPGSYDDVSRRTVDVREPNHRRGHVHPRNVLLHLAPPTGFFPWRSPGTPPEDRILDEPGEHRLEGEVLARLEVTAGSVELRGCAVEHLEITAPASGSPVLAASDCLFGSVRFEGAAEMEYCTVLETAHFGTLQASDCIFPQDFEVDASPSCVRYSRVPATFVDELAEEAKSRVGDQGPRTTVHAVTSAEPVFMALRRSEGGSPPAGAGAFGEPGCGVLHPAAPASVRAGAEDGGEMGAFHRAAFCLENEAVLHKVARHLPVGVRPVLVIDEHLLSPPSATRGA